MSATTNDISFLGDKRFAVGGLQHDGLRQRSPVHGVREVSAAQNVPLGAGIRDQPEDVARDPVLADVGCADRETGHLTTQSLQEVFGAFVLCFQMLHVLLCLCCE